MTVIDRRFFDELAQCLKSNQPGNSLILQIADVCARANRNFHRDWFINAAGYQPPPNEVTPKSKVLKLGNKMRVVSTTEDNDEAFCSERGWRRFGSVFYHDYTDSTIAVRLWSELRARITEQPAGDETDPPPAPKGWEQIDAEERINDARPTRADDLRSSTQKEKEND